MNLKSRLSLSDYHPQGFRIADKPDRYPALAIEDEQLPRMIEQADHGDLHGVNQLDALSGLTADLWPSYRTADGWRSTLRN